MRNMAMFKSFALLLIGSLTVSLAPVANGGQDLGLRLEWRSETRDGTELALALERLYITLYNTGNLPTVEVADPAHTGRVVVDLLRSRGLFFGEFLPVGVDAVLCDLNPRVCGRSKEAVNDKQLRQIDSHVGGYRKTLGQWSNGPNTPLRLPDLTFEQYVTIADVPYQKGVPLDNIAKTTQLDCSQYGMPCQDVVQRLNRSLFDPKRDPGKTQVTHLKVPVQGLKTQLALGADDASRLKRSYETYQRYTSQPLDRLSDWQREFSAEYKSFLKGKSPADLAFTALKDNLLSFGSTSLQAVDDALFDDERLLLTLIHHPLVTTGSFAEALRQPVAVAVLDTRFDKDHCELQDAVEADDSLSGGLVPLSDRPLSTECGALYDHVSIAEDHGTHVAGIIAASINTHGVVGLAPYARMKYISLDSISLQGDVYRDKVAQKIVSLGLLAASPVRIANISWKYANETNLDAIKNAIKNLEQSTLFVVAAGNGKKELGNGGCGDYPACFGDKPNVVVVGGLDRSERPKLWNRTNGEGSNWGASVALSAVAEDVLSTASRSYTGRMSGTSQAAPQVSAAAALLYSVYKSHHEIDAPALLPIRVKNRLIYTSDLFNELLTKAQGGRLNIERVLDTASDVVQIRVGNELRGYKGKLTKFGNFPPGGEYIECERDNGSITAVQYRALRRMFYDEFRKKYVIFYNSAADNRDSALMRITDCELKTRTHEVVFEPESDPAEVRFQFRDIRDYVSRMF